jgi:hypothetical protein
MESTEVNEGIWELRLYVAGKTQKSVTALSNLQKYCEEHLKDKYVIELLTCSCSHNLRKVIRSWLFLHW